MIWNVICFLTRVDSFYVNCYCDFFPKTFTLGEVIRDVSIAPKFLIDLCQSTFCAILHDEAPTCEAIYIIYERLLHLTTRLDF